MSSRIRPKRWLAVTAALLAPLALVGFVGCGSKPSVWPDHPGPKVVVSFAPYYCFAVNVAGDDAVVKNMMAATGPHREESSEMRYEFERDGTVVASVLWEGPGQVTVDGMAVAGVVQRRDQGDVDIELQLFALASVG